VTKYEIKNLENKYLTTKRVEGRDLKTIARNFSDNEQNYLVDNYCQKTPIGRIKRDEA